MFVKDNGVIRIYIQLCPVGSESKMVCDITFPSWGEGGCSGNLQRTTVQPPMAKYQPGEKKKRIQMSFCSALGKVEPLAFTKRKQNPLLSNDKGE